MSSCRSLRRFNAIVPKPRAILSCLVLAGFLLVSAALAAADPIVRDLLVNPAEFVGFGSAPGDRLGLSLAVGDLNGDGFADVASGAPLGEKPGDTQFSRGELHVYFGFASFSGARDAAQPGSPDLVVFGEVGAPTPTSRTGDVLGKGVAINGDINGDGRNDLVVSALRASGPTLSQRRIGKVYVFYQDPSGTWPSVIDLSTTPGLADVTILGDIPQGDFGIHLDTGDFNADGFDDILIGASATLAASTKPGGLRVVYGGPSLPSTIDMAAPPSGVATFFVQGEAVGDKLGHGVVAADLTGDGIDDIIGGAPQGGGACTSPPPPTDVGGKAYVFFGGAGPAAPTGGASASAADVSITSGMGLNDQMARRLAVGDVNGDGSADLVLASRCADGPGDARADAGEGYVLFGPLAPGPRNLALSPPDVTIHGSNSADELGVGPGVGDVNGDGVGDVMLGAQGGDGPGNRSSAGEVAVLFGPLAPVVRDLAASPADVTVFGTDPGDRLGRFVAAADMNGDGVVDLGATAPFSKGAANTSAWNQTGEFVVLTSLT